ncbi:MAG: hypothetical protein Kow0042_17410 [Calditrichia bacterium]
MKKLIVISAIILLVIVYCSEKKEPFEVTTHPANWLKNHGVVVIQDSSLSKESCQTCHGENYDGGTAGVSCLNCHAYPHLPVWLDTAAAGFHGTVSKTTGYDQCKDCHGANFKGGSSGVACFDCHTYPHLDPWKDVNAGEFHGKTVLATGEQQCQACHGETYAGGSSGVSCFACHTFPHKEGFLQATSPNFHGEFIKSEINWNLSECQACHGSDYAGGRVNFSCNTCHNQPGGPEACNSCHGSSQNFAPPQDLSNNTDISAVGVGAHQKHVATTDITTLYDCLTCHPPVLNFSDASHIDDTPFSEIQFSVLATDSGRLAPVWNHNSATCSEVYCHGNFRFKKSESGNPFGYADSVIVGNGDPVTWTQPASGEPCTFCHGLPPTGHINFNFTINSCANCHGSVVDANGNIIDKTRHINGQANLN